MLIALGWCGFGSGEPLALLTRTGPLLDETKDSRNEENADEARSQHASDDGCTHDLPSHSSGSGGRPEWDGTQNEGE